AIDTERFQNANIASALNHGGVHGEKNHKQTYGDGQGDHGVDKSLEARDVRGGHQRQEVFQWTDGVGGEDRANLGHNVVGMFRASALEQENASFIASTDKILKSGNRNKETAAF